MPKRSTGYKNIRGLIYHLDLGQLLAHVHDADIENHEKFR
jgi:hypothetical protein